MSDPFANLPAAPPARPNTSTTPAEISLDDIKDYISPKLYSELSWDESRSGDDVTKDCISRAIEFASGLLYLVKEELNLYSKTQREVVKALTVYELYLYNGDRRTANGWLEKAERLINDRYGNINAERENVSPVGAVRV
ncbi:MAG: hypothetical protein P1P63_00050 [Treponemataceae bacterium]